MAVTRNERESPPVIELEAELRRRVDEAAGALGLSAPDYVVTVIRHAVTGGTTAGAVDSAAWSRLSSASFGRD